MDGDHDGLIQLSDLIEYDDNCLTSVVCHRIINGHGRKPLSTVPQTLNYFDFIIFFISEIDKTSEISINYWFNILNVDNLDYLTTDVLYEFFKEQHARMSVISSEPIQWSDILCQLCDMIHKSTSLDHTVVFTRKDIVQSKMSTQFFNTIFNLNKFLHGESRDAQRIRHKHETAELNDWTRYACYMYFRLAEGDVDSSTNDVDIDDGVVEPDHNYQSISNKNNKHTHLFNDNSAYNKALNALNTLRETDHDNVAH